MENCSNNFFSGFMNNLRLKKKSYLLFFMLTEHFVISSCCVVTSQNLTLDASTISSSRNMQEFAVEYVKKFPPNLENLLLS